MKRWSETHEAYTAAELREAHPEGFDAAREQYAAWEWEDGYIVESTLDDLVDNVLPALGLTGGFSPRDGLSWSLSSFPVPGEYVRLNRTLYVEDRDWFFRAVTAGESDAADYSRAASPVAIDRRSRLWQRTEITFDRDGAHVEIVDAEDLDNTAYNALADQADALADALTEWIGDVLAHAVKATHDEYDYQTSVAGFLDATEANDWYFDARGHIVTPPPEAIDTERED